MILKGARSIFLRGWNFIGGRAEFFKGMGFQEEGSRFFYGDGILRGGQLNIFQLFFFKFNPRVISMDLGGNSVFG